MGEGGFGVDGMVGAGGGMALKNSHPYFDAKQ